MAEIKKKKSIIYKCAPNKNTRCKKTGCFYAQPLGECSHNYKKNFL